MAAESFAPILLKGVTGSGKTEVYLEAVAECLTRGRQAMVLLPEIALTADFLARVEARFGARPAEWHSGVTQTERRRLWRMVGQGGAQKEQVQLMVRTLLKLEGALGPDAADAIGIALCHAFCRGSRLAAAQGAVLGTRA